MVLENLLALQRTNDSILFCLEVFIYFYVNIMYVCMYAGLLGSLFSLLQFIGSPLIGAASDVTGRKPMLLLSMVTLFTTCMILFPVCAL